jgi:hypothetical protein
MPHLGQFHDDSIYWVSAKSLAEGRGYRILSLPEQPYQTKYPPLYSLLLAGIWKVSPRFPENVPLATAFAWLWLPACLLLCRPVLRDLGLGRRHALAVVALVGLNPYVILYSVSLMSEVPFTCLLLGCFVVARRAEQPGASRWMAAAAGALGGAAYLMRSAALPLLATAPLYFLLRRRRAQAAVFFATMFPAVAGWTWWARAHAVRTSDPVLLYYTDYIGYHLASFTWQDVPLLVWKNALGMLEGSGSLLMVFGEGLPAGLVGAAAILGAARLARSKGVSQYHLYAAACLVMLLPWHLGLRDRYMRLVLPLLPLILAGFTEECRRAVAQAREWFGSQEPRRLAAGCALAVGLGAVVLLGAANTLATWGQFPGFVAGARSTRESNRGAYEWIKTHLAAEATFLAGPDPVVYLYTGRRGIHLIVPPRLLYREERQEIARVYAGAAEYARARGLSYVLASRDGELEQAGDRIGSHRLSLAGEGVRTVYQSGGVSIYALD